MNEFIHLIEQDDYELDSDLLLKNIFRDLDIDKDGLLTENEFKKATNLIKDSALKLVKSFDQIDSENVGKIKLERKLSCHRRYQ